MNGRVTPDRFKPMLDREFLKAGGVFTDEAIDAYIALRREEDDRVRMTPHPVEFELYYSV